MEKSASRTSRPPYEEIRIFVKAKNSSPDLAKEIKPNLEPKKMGNSKDVQRLINTKSLCSRSRDLFDTKSHELKRVLRSRFSRNEIANWRVSRNLNQHQKGSNIKKIVPIALSVCGAVVVGVVLGISILSLFFSNHTDQSNYAIDSHLPKEKAENQIISLPPLRMVMLQGGIFSEEKRAHQAVNELRARGIGAVMSSVSPFRVFLGLAPNDDLAGKLATIYKKENVDVYKKELDIRNKIELTPEQRKLENIIKKGNYLIYELSKRSSEGVFTNTVMPLNSKISQNYDQFNRDVQIVISQLPMKGKRELTEMKLAMDDAMKSAIQDTMKWKVQEGLIRYVTAYEQLIRLLSSRSTN